MSGNRCPFPNCKRGATKNMGGLCANHYVINKVAKNSTAEEWAALRVDALRVDVPCRPVYENRTCHDPRCDKQPSRKGLCNTHYQAEYMRIWRSNQ